MTTENGHALNILKSIMTQMDDNDLTMEERAEFLKHVAKGLNTLRKTEIVHWFLSAEAPDAEDLEAYIDLLM